MEYYVGLDVSLCITRYIAEHTRPAERRAAPACPPAGALSTIQIIDIYIKFMAKLRWFQ
jgi:hypothetical protein